MPLFGLLFVSPAKSVLDSEAMATRPAAERESWLRSWGRRQVLETSLKVVTFGALLLVLGAKGEEGALARLTRP